MKSCEVQSMIILLRSGVLCLSKTLRVAKRERKHKDSVRRGVLGYVLKMQLVLFPRTARTDCRVAFGVRPDPPPAQAVLFSCFSCTEA